METRNGRAGCIFIHVSKNRTPPKKQLYLQRPEELEEPNSPAATGSLPGLPAAARGSGTYRWVLLEAVSSNLSYCSWGINPAPGAFVPLAAHLKPSRGTGAGRCIRLRLLCQTQLLRAAANVPMCQCACFNTCGSGVANRVCREPGDEYGYSRDVVNDIIYFRGSWDRADTRFSS